MEMEPLDHSLASLSLLGARISTHQERLETLLRDWRAIA